MSGSSRASVDVYCRLVRTRTRFRVQASTLGVFEQLYSILRRECKGLGLELRLRRRRELGWRRSSSTPTSRKKFSSPDGEQRHSNRTGSPDPLWNWCGALDGMLTVSPACTVDFLPRKVTSSSPSSIMNVSSKSWRCGGGPPPV